MASPYDWSPESVGYARQYGGGLMKSGSDASPVGHWTQALARVLQGGVGGYMVGQANEGERIGKQQVADTYKAGLEQNLPMNKLAATLMGNPWGAEQGQALAKQHMVTAQSQGFQTEQQKRQFEQQMLMQKNSQGFQAQQQQAQFGQQRSMAEFQNQLQQQREPDIARQLRAAGVDPNSPQGRQIILESIKGQNPVDQAVAGMLQGALPRQTVPPPPPAAPARPPVAVNPPPAAGAPPPAAPPLVTAPQPPAPPLLPQSAPVQQNDPYFIRTQSAPQQQPDPTQTGGMFDNMPAGEKRRTAEALLLNPRTKPLGEQLMKDIERDQLGKEAGNANDKKELEAYDALGQIKQIRSSFDPSFLTYGKQGAMAWASLVSKVGTLKPEQQQELYRFATFRRDTAARTNAAIKANSGATVTEQEMRRNLLELPNAGTGIFDGDDPVTFKAKIDRAEETITLGVARTRYLRQQGFKGDINQMASVLPVEGMRQLINKRAAQIEAEVRQQKPGLQSNIVNREVDARVKAEFGI